MNEGMQLFGIPNNCYRRRTRKEGTYKKFLLVRQEGKRKVQREIDHYNLNIMGTDTMTQCYGKIG